LGIPRLQAGEQSIRRISTTIPRLIADRTPKSSLPPARLPAFDRLRLAAIRATERQEHGTAHLFVVVRSVTE